MPAREDETARSAGISSADATLVFERLKEEVRRPEAASGPSRTPAARASARGEAERLWSVAVDRPIERRSGIRGALVYPAKRVLRKLMSWYVGPFAAEQRSFNAAALRLSDELSVQIDELRVLQERENAELASEVRALEASAGARASALAEKDAELERLLEELQQRLLRLERRPRAAPAAAPASTASPAPAPEGEPDYFAFEARMRGSTEEIRERQRGYVDDFRGREPVLDVGCGRGEFLQLMREAGIEARGVDIDSDMVAFCRGEGLSVEEADATSYLAKLPDGELGGVFCAHVLEHLQPKPLLRLLELAHTKLRPDGLFVAETPNPRTLVSLGTFFADLSHAQPLHPETLSFLVRQAGFRRVQVRYLNPPPPEGRLRPVPLPEEAALAGANAVLDANIERLNEVLFGPQDYAVVAHA